MKGWTRTLLAAWLVLLIASQIRTELPAGWWFRPADPAVRDAPAGTCPQMTWSREVRRPFEGRWLAVLQRRTSPGAWHYVRSYSGETDYRPDAALPPRLDLGWWFEIPPEACVWAPGVYRVVTVWTIHPDSGDPRRVRATSGPFEITSAR